MRTKKVLSAFLSFVLMLSCLSVSAFAEAENKAVYQHDGTKGQVTVSIDGLTISAAMVEFYVQENNTSGERVGMPKGGTSVSKNNITQPYSVTFDVDDSITTDNLSTYFAYVVYGRGQILRLPLTTTASDTYTVSGAVKRGTGVDNTVSLSGIAVTLYAANGDALGDPTNYTANTDDNGAYSITGVPAGSYFAVVAASSGSYQLSKSAKITVESAAVTDRDITLVAEGVTTYTVTVQSNNTDWGTASADVQTAAAGATVNLTATPKQGYRLKEWTASGGTFESAIATTTTYTMPASDVTITATFEERPPETYSVTINAGSNMTKTAGSGAASQTNLSGAMTAVTYEANEGYYFPDSYKATFNPTNGAGLKSERTADENTGASSVTVSGTPAANVTVTLPAATAKVKESVANAKVSAVSSDTVNLTDLTNGGKYVITGAALATSLQIDGVEFTANGTTQAVKVSTDVDSGTITIKKLAANKVTNVDSDVKNLTWTRAAAPTGVQGVKCATSANNDGKITGVNSTMEYSSDGGKTWKPITGSQVTGLTPGDYQVRVKVNGTTLASKSVPVSIAKHNQLDAPEITDKKPETNGEYVYTADELTDGKLTVSVKPVDGATIKYTTDGSDPSVTNGTAAPADGKISVTVPATLKIAVVPNAGSDMIASEVVTATYVKGWTVTFNTNGHGKAASQKVADGKTAKEVKPSASGWRFDGWYTTDTLETKFNFSTAIVGDTTLYAKWTKASTPDGTPTTPSTPSATPAHSYGGGGSTGTAGVNSAAGGGSGSVTPTPSTAPNGGDNSTGGVGGFGDVKSGDYFAAPVLWALNNGVTNGVGEGQFGPEAPCTRAQMVTFLYRAAGSPDAEITDTFKDVSADAYYAKAVSWAVANEITNGKGANDVFAPDDLMTRAEAVTFLCRALKGSSTGSANFSDVPANAWFAGAVAWAVENGITNGMGDNQFQPNTNVNRAMSVTFLYRAYGNK